MKKILSLVLSLVILAALSIPAFAIEDSNAVQDDIANLRTIALNTPSVFGHGHGWSISQETPLYNSADVLTSYCFDMISKDSPQVTAYAIVSINKTDFPVLLFGYKGTSAYYGKSFDRAYYLGTLDFYVESNDVYQSARMGTTLTSSQVEALFDADSAAISLDANDYSSIRQQYLANYLPASMPDTDSISNGASLQWRSGCAPTAVAMLIKTKYSSLDGNTLIDNLATYMETGSNGATDFDKITSGTKAYFADRSWLTSPTTCGWNSTKSDGTPRTGAQYNSKDSFKSSISAGFPVGVYCASSNVTTTGYPNGIGAHMMSGIGYSYSSSGDFITCYTTNTADGEVSFPLTSSGLKNHAWFWLKW